MRSDINQSDKHQNNSNDNKIRLDAGKKPEFNDWYWVQYGDPLKQVIYFKRDIYRKVLAEFEHTVVNLKTKNNKN